MPMHKSRDDKVTPTESISTQREQAGKDRISGWRRERLKGTKRFTDISDRELNIGPATPIGRGDQPLDPSAHPTARNIFKAAITMLPFGRVIGVRDPRLYKKAPSVLTKARNKASAAAFKRMRKK